MYKMVILYTFIFIRKKCVMAICTKLEFYHTGHTQNGHFIMTWYTKWSFYYGVCKQWPDYCVSWWDVDDNSHFSMARCTQLCFYLSGMQLKYLRRQLDRFAKTFSPTNALWQRFRSSTNWFIILHENKITYPQYC